MFSTSFPTARRLFFRDSSLRLPASATDAHLSLRARVDFFVALLVLIAVSPVMLIAMVLTKLTSRGPAIYAQVRLGLRGRPFTIYKIRTMTHNCEGATGARWCVPNDPRVTPLGKLLRKCKIDELPQLWNVLRGEMSLVGPRPERPEIVAELDRVIPHYRRRLLVPPGVSGLAQVQLPADTSLQSVRRKLACDLYYGRHISWWLDVKVLLATACYMLGCSFTFIRLVFNFPSPEEQVGQKAATSPVHAKPIASGVDAVLENCG